MVLVLTTYEDVFSGPRLVKFLNVNHNPQEPLITKREINHHTQYITSQLSSSMYTFNSHHLLGHHEGMFGA